MPVADLTGPPASSRTPCGGRAKRYVGPLAVHTRALGPRRRRQQAGEKGRAVLTIRWAVAHRGCCRRRLQWCMCLTGIILLIILIIVVSVCADPDRC